ncbi:MAG: dephospho-CoA kinase [Clostridiaceae bacterium]|nr:dephospho-CoA kinase [Clostridiaceae bacterium]
MFVIGITGGIGSGKSSVARILRVLGIPILDADAIAHELTAVQGETNQAIAQALGPEVLRKDGSLDRPYLADLAFSNKRVLDSLSAIIHQEVIKTMEDRMDQEKARKTKVLALDVPIPVKRGFLDICDQVWTVRADQEIRLARLQQRGMDRDEALRRIQVQMTPEEYRELADHEIENNGNLLELEERVKTLLKEELAQRGISLPGLAP